MTGKGNLNLSWEASLDNGGCEIEGYTLAYDVVGPEAIGAGGTVFYSPHEVTVLRVTDSDSPDRSGTYRVAYDGHVTDEIPVDATAGELKNALQAVPSIGQVAVERSVVSTDAYGYAYTIVFESPSYAEHVQDMAALTVSTDAAHYPGDFASEMAGGSLVSATTKVEIIDVAGGDGFHGFEQQVVLIAAGGSLKGTFRLSYLGEATLPLSWDASSAEVKAGLERLSSAPVVHVVRKAPRIPDAGAPLGYYAQVSFRCRRCGDAPSRFRKPRNPRNPRNPRARGPAAPPKSRLP